MPLIRPPDRSHWMRPRPDGPAPDAVGAGILSAPCGALLALAAQALRAPRLWVAASLVATLAAALALPRLEIRTDGAALDLPDDEVFVASRVDQALFGDSDLVVVLVQSSPAGPRLDSPEGLAALRGLHDRFRGVPGVRSSGVRSLASVTDLRVGDGALVAEPFLADIPGDPAGRAAWLRRLRAQPATEAAFLSADGTAAAFYLPAAHGAERARFVEAVSSHLEADPPRGLEWSLTGPLVAESLLGSAVLADLGRLIPAMGLVLCLALGLFLRSPGALLLVTAEVTLVLVWTFAGMALAGWPLTLVTTPLPVVLLAMAISDEVHVLERFQALLAEALARGEEPSAAVAGCLSTALAQLVTPLVATTLTTCVGLLTFTLSGLPALRVFGAASAFGVALALLGSFTLLPAIAVLLPPRSLLRLGGVSGGGRELTRGNAPGALVLRRPVAAAAVALALLLAAAPGVAHVEVGDNWLDNFAPDSSPVVADRAFNRHFWGSYRLDVVLEGRPELFYRPDGARLVEEVQAIAAAEPAVSGTLSYLDAVQAVLRAHGDAGPASALPPARLADYAILGAMSEDPGGADAMVSPDGGRSRVRLFLRGEDFERDRDLLRRLDARLGPLADRHGIGYHFSGAIPKGLRMVREIVRYQLVSVGLVYLLIGLIVLSLYPGGTGGLVVLAPLIGSVLVVFGVMGYAGIRLGIATAMFSSLTAGVGVDFGLHLAAGWRSEQDRGDGAAVAFRAAGRAVTWNAVVLVAGFSVLTLSALRPNRALGSLLVLGITAAYLLTILSLPTLLALRERAWRRPVRPVPDRGVEAGKRPRPGTTLLLVAVAAGVAVPAGAAAGEDAATLMSEVEERFRSESRVIRMDVVTSRAAAATSPVRPPREEVALWGVLASEGPETHVLFAFVEPERYRGVGLMLRSRLGVPTEDQMWYRMRTFDRFREIPRTSLKLRVPGTAVTYEDAHGFFSANRYRFEAAGGPAGDGATTIVAKPRLPGLADALGFSTAHLEVDRARRLMTRVEVRSADGRALRTYRVERARRLGDVWLPERARVEDVESGVVSEIDYRYWALSELPADFFSVDPDPTPLLERVRQVLAGTGALGDSASTVRPDLATPPGLRR